jgi:exodeoxyribonuclease V alpha subunit
MQTLKDVHHQFAVYFQNQFLQPYIYLVSKKLSEGHICLRLDSLDREKADLFENWQAYLDDTERLERENIVTTDPDGYQPFVLYNRRLYLHRYFQYESRILQRILVFISHEERFRAERIQALKQNGNFISNLFREEGLSEARPNWQLAAAVSAVLQNFTIITGGPGTGKTTTVAKVLALLHSINKSLRVALAAPTGKAAARMAESLKNAKVDGSEELAAFFQALEPSTIHRLLGFIPDSPFFKHNRENPLHVDVIIVDESSMIDVALFAKLLDAIGPDTRLILLGDKDQLSSVEAGSLFGDLCQAQEPLNVFGPERLDLINSFADQLARVPLSGSHQSRHPLAQHVIELKFSRRFKDEEGIGKFSKAIIKNDVSVVRDFIRQERDEHVAVDTQYSDGLFSEFIRAYERYIKEPDISLALKYLNDLRVLCAMREGPQGLYAMNLKIEKYLEARGLIQVDREFYHHRPIIVSSNNYNLGLFNGDVGLIRPDDKGVLYAWFENKEGKVRSYSPGFITNCETVFAMTIHKSQGSEFTKVLVVLPDDSNSNLLTRELLYTGITRARDFVLLQGSEDVIVRACDRFVERASGIVERLNQVEA